MAKINFEKETCSRCGGGGEYSYCQMYGKTCFKCGGSGKQLSRAGKAAKKRITALMDTFNKPAADLAPGDRVNLHGKWKSVVTVGPSGSRCKSGSDTECTEMLEIKTTGLGLGCAPETMIKVFPSNAAFSEQVVPLAKKLKGAIVTE